jgi:AcrR family transcriptional regulator
MFLKLGFKSITMDDIVALCISKKTIYKYFTKKSYQKKALHRCLRNIRHHREIKHNAIHENFEIQDV